MRTEIALCALIAALAGCAGVPPAAPQPDAADAIPAIPAAPCVPPTGPAPRADLCGYPPDVRAFVEDRAACDHFRGEPWPEGDAPEDRARRRQLVDGVRTRCAGIDRRLDALMRRHEGDPKIVSLLSGYDRAGD